MNLQALTLKVSISENTVERRGTVPADSDGSKTMGPVVSPAEQKSGKHQCHRGKDDDCCMLWTRLCLLVIPDLPV